MDHFSKTGEKKIKIPYIKTIKKFIYLRSCNEAGFGVKASFFYVMSIAEIIAQ